MFIIKKSSAWIAEFFNSSTYGATVFVTLNVGLTWIEASLETLLSASVSVQLPVVGASIVPAAIVNVSPTAVDGVTVQSALVSVIVPPTVTVTSKSE